MAASAELLLQFAGTELEGRLTTPDRCLGLVIFAHGSGSSRLSPRHQAVSEGLVQAGFATLLFDLLTSQEAKDRTLVFDVDFLAGRLVEAIEWSEEEESIRDLPIGLFGASTGAAAALIASSIRPDCIRAVVSRGGRPDLAMHALDRVMAPTLLIVGGHDSGVIGLNRVAFERLRGAKDLTVVAKATHLFEEPGALEEVTDLARDWFLRFLPRYLPRRTEPSEHSSEHSSEHTSEHSSM